MKFLSRFLLACAFLLILLTASCDKECKHPNIQEQKTSPTCTDAGMTVYTCSDCKITYNDNIVPPKGHTYSENVITPDCENGGYTEYSCNCGHSYVSDHTDALGHDFRSIVDLPNCDSVGQTTHICDTCDYTYISDYVKPKGHVFSKETVSEVSCTEIGEVKYTCECGLTYSELFYPTGHKYVHSSVMPTLSDMGYTEYLCETCDFSYIGNYRFYSAIVDSAYADGAGVLAEGIDISVYNHKAGMGGAFLPLDWESIKNEGVDYVILKAGSTLRENGTLGGIDTTFEMDYADAKAAGVDVGVYFYTYATNVEQIKTDAYMLLAMLDGKQFEYPIYLDLEDDSIRGLGAELLNEMCVEFFTILQRAGYYTGLYVNHEWLYNVLDTDVALSKFDIWYARYPGSEAPSWDADENGMPFGMWQYTDFGSLASLPDTVVDKNYAYIDYPSIIKNGGFNGYEAHIKFQDDGKQFVWIKANSLTVRSSSDFSATDNIVAYVGYGDRFEVLELNEAYTKIVFEGKEAYISANSDYISLIPVWEKFQ